MQLKWQRGKKFHTALGLIFSVLLWAVFMLPTVSMAADKSVYRVGVAVQPGLGGLYKVGLPTGLEITIANRGDGFKGLLVVEPDKDSVRRKGSVAAAKFQKSVEVPAGGVIKTSMMVPGDMINMNAAVVLLADGAPVAAGPIQGTAVNGGLIALSLGEKPLRGGVAAWLDNTFGGQTTVKYLAPSHLPQDPLELGMVDVIIVDEQSVSQLSQRQVKLLKDWVYQGGMTIISGGAGTRDGGPLSELSPVMAEEQKVISADLGGLQVAQGNMTITTGRLLRGEVLTKVNGVALVASRSFGKGRVIYSGVSLENIASGSAAIWPIIFGQGNDLKGFDLRKGQELKYIGNDVLGNVAAYLPQLQTPPVPRVVAAWAVYILVVGPVLYLVLKRYDRRDWLWWLIPTCALVTTGVVYFMSPAQRINAPISQTLAVIDIMDEDSAWVNATAAFISPYGGTLNVQGAKGSMVWPSNNYSNPSQKAPIIQYDDRYAPRLSYPDVEYWSMRLARATAIKEDFGSIGGKLILENGRIKGKLENHTQLDLRDCRIIIGGKSIAVEKIPAGGTVEINESLSLSKWGGSLGPNDFRNELVPPQKPGQEELYVRERQMIDTVLQSSVYMESESVVFLGWSEYPLDMFKILSDRKNIREFNLSLVKQELLLELPEGKIVQLPPGMLQPKVMDNRGAFDRNPLGYTLFEGKITLALNLNKPFSNKPYRVVAMDLPAQQSKNLAMKIYDWQDKKWLDVPLSGLIIGPGELKRYRSPSGECRLQVEKTSGIGQPDRIVLPAISVEGVVNQ